MEADSIPRNGGQAAGVGARLDEEGRLVSRTAQRPLDQRGRFLPVAIRITEGADGSARQLFQAPLGLAELLLGDFVVDNAAAEHMRAGVVSHLAAEPTKESQLILREE